MFRIGPAACAGLFLAHAAVAAPKEARSVPPSAKPAPLVRSAEVNRAAVIRELSDFSREGMSRRLGPDYAFYHRAAAAEKPFPEIWLAPTKQDANGRRYQIGGPWSTSGGDFSSTQGQILYVPDDAQALGIDRVTILEMTNATYSERPEPPWHGGFRPEPMSSGWHPEGGARLSVAVAAARGMGCWANCGIIAFPSGFVCSAGTCTARGSNPTLQLPAGKVPTAVAVSPKNEFAFITVFDAQARRGQVAVIAITSGGTGFAHDWKTARAGLCSVALITGLKLLGFIDLPGIEFPTSICAVGDTTQPRVNGPDGHAGTLSTFDLARQSDRDGFLKGNNASYVTRAGFAVVAGKYEQKVAFIDLQPLFQRTREMYLTTEANYRKTLDAGPDPKQWPYTFDADPVWKPVVVRVVPHPEPTAVIASMDGGDRARVLVASLDGKVGLYGVGGLANEAPALPKDIAYYGAVQVGRNPVCLTYQKYTRDTVIAVSRGDREIAWIKYTDRDATVVRRLRDARLLDPVFAEMGDTHGTDTGIITVADFKGRQIINYRFDDIVFATNGGARFGMGADGKAEFECGGVMTFPGAPYGISATNVN
jgi:hypothetical protein